MEESTLSLPEAAALLVSTRQARGVSQNYLVTLRTTLAKLARFHPGPLAQLEAAALERWLATLRPRTANNYLRLARQLAAFARRRKLLAHDWRELEALELRIEAPRAPLVYSPAEARALVNACGPEIRAVVVLVLFGGVRVAEALRLEWPDVCLVFGRITIVPAKAKTRAWRVCPIAENLRAWLAGAPVSGPVFAGKAKRFHDLLALAFRRAGVAPRRNGLRHSFISYRLALSCDAARTALASGTSEGMLFRNYRELVDAADAARFWAIVPEFGLLLAA